MNLREELNQAFEERNCTVKWLEGNTEKGWDFNTQTFFEDEMGLIIGPRTGKEIVDHIFSFNLTECKKRHFTLMLRELPEECIHAVGSMQNYRPICMLYYNYK